MLEMKDFSGRQKGERIEIFVRSHPLYLFWRLLPSVLLLAAAVALCVVVRHFPAVSGRLVPFGLGLLFLSLLAMVWRFALWYYDYFLITDRRVIDFVKRPFLSEMRNETQLSRIQDAQVVYPNALAVLLNFGHVLVQTAGMTGQLSFRFAARPNELQARLLDLVAHSQGPRSEASSLGQLVEALRNSLDSRQPGAGPAPPAPGVRAEAPPTAKVRSRGLYDIVLFRPVREAGARTWRKHWLRLVQAAIRPAIVIAVALGLLILVPSQIVRAIAIAMLPLGVLYLMWQTADWYNDVYIVTRDRIIDIEKVPFLSEDRREARLIMIQDVNYSQPNVIAKLFNFGNVVVQTAGRTGAFTFTSVPNPRDVQREIFERWERARLAQRAPVSSETVQDFLGVLDRYHELKHKKRP